MREEFWTHNFEINKNSCSAVKMDAVRHQDPGKRGGYSRFGELKELDLPSSLTMDAKQWRSAVACVR